MSDEEREGAEGHEEHCEDLVRSQRLFAEHEQARGCGREHEEPKGREPAERDPSGWHRPTLTGVVSQYRCARCAYRVGVGNEGDPHGLLAGVRVLDLSIWRPGPYATQLLVELAADVVKIEPPGGDPMRVFPTLFAVLNAGKRGAAVDLKDAAGKTAVLEAAAGADVVVEGFRPGVVRSLGVDDERVRRVNPNVVYCSISGYGQHGPLAGHPGHDINYQSWAATLEPRGPDDEPVVPRPPIADLAGGAYAAFAVCAALVRRSRTGEGESIDVSMTDVLARSGAKSRGTGRSGPPTAAGSRSG